MFTTELGHSRFATVIPSWWYWHPRVLGSVHLAVGIFLTGLGAVFVSYGLIGPAVFVLAFAALHFAVSYLQVAFTRWAPPRPRTASPAQA